MENETLLKEVTAKAQTWLGDGYDEATKAEVRRMLDNDDKTELIESFYKDLEFGTGGLRGIMGAGTNRMNIYTVMIVVIIVVCLQRFLQIFFLPTESRYTFLNH